jgi:hypothetical protein
MNRREFKKNMTRLATVFLVLISIFAIVPASQARDVNEPATMKPTPVVHPPIGSTQWCTGECWEVATAQCQGYNDSWYFQDCFRPTFNECMDFCESM